MQLLKTSFPSSCWSLPPNPRELINHIKQTVKELLDNLGSIVSLSLHPWVPYWCLLQWPTSRLSPDVISWISHSGQWWHREPIHPAAKCMGNSNPPGGISRQLRAPSGSHLDDVNPTSIRNDFLLLSLCPIVVMRHHDWYEAQSLFHVTALAANSFRNFF